MNESLPMMVSLQEIMAGLLSFKKFSGNRMRILCDSINAIPYRDIIELYLIVSGVTRWEWIDHNGSALTRQTFFQILSNIIRDMMSWPFIYFNIIKDIRKIASNHVVIARDMSLSNVLYLRTDHWFNVKSGGSVGHISGVLKGLRSNGFETHVISTDHLTGIVEDRHFHVCSPIYDTGKNLPNVPEFLFNEQLRRSIESKWYSISPSFIYQRYSLGNYIGPILKQKYGVPYVCEYNGSFPWMARQWIGRKLFHEKLMEKVEIVNLKCADIVIVVSEAMKNELVIRGIRSNKILAIPNGVDPDVYSPDVDGALIRKKYGLEEKVVVGFIGTFGKWHGAEVLADAFGKLIQQYPEYRNTVRLLMIGDGMTMPAVKRNLARHGIRDISILTGLVPQEDGPSHMAAGDILVASHVPNPDGTPFFGSPTKLFEYMAMGKGIVASDLDQIGEVLEHEKTALLVKPGEAESLMRGIKKLIDDKTLRRRIGRAAREEVIAKYTWNEHTRKIIDKLKEVTQTSQVKTSISV